MKRRIRLYLWSTVVIVFVGFGFNLYNNLSHSTFSLEVKGTHNLYKFPSNVLSGTPVYPVTKSSTSTTFGSLETSWWGNGNQPAYILDNSTTGLCGFELRPTLRGDFSIVLGPSAVVGVLEIKNSNGAQVNFLIPGQWYQVEQYGDGKWYKMEFE